MATTSKTPTNKVAPKAAPKSTTLKAIPGGASAKDRADALARTNSYEKANGLKVTTASEAESRRQAASKSISKARETDPYYGKYKPGSIPEVDNLINVGNVNNTPSIDAPTIGTQPKLNLAQIPTTNSDFSSFVGSVGATTNLQTQYDQQAKDAQAKVDEQQAKLDRINKFSLTDEYAKLQKQQGVPDLTKKLQEANLTLTQMQNEYQLQNNTLEQQTVPEPFVIGQQNELQKTAAIKIGAQAAIVQVLQGNLDLANHYVDKVIDLEYKDFQRKYEAQKYNLEAAKDLLTKTEAKQAKLLDHQLDLQKASYTSFLNLKNDLAKEAIKKGFAGDLGAIMSATDYEQLGSFMSKYTPSGTPITRANAQNNVATANNVINSRALDSTVGTSIFSRAASSVGGTIGRFFTGLIGGGAAGAAIGSVFGGVGAIPGAILGGLAGGISLVSQGAKDSFSGDRQDFIASVEQLRGQLTLDNLINAKARGATFGALSEGELQLLQNSGSKLSSWAIKDKVGNVTGYNVSEKVFKKEIDKINNFAKLDYLNKGGTPTDVGAQVMPDGSVWTMNSDGTMTQLK